MAVYSYNGLKEFISILVKTVSPKFFRLIVKHKTGVKYLFSGGTAAFMYLSILFILTDIFEVWYLFSSIMAFVVSLLTNFFLQKFWTFRDNNWQRLKKQLVIYGLLGIMNFILNPILLYAFVEKFHVWYLLAATIVIGSLAIINYIVNKFITFKKDISHESVNV
ncbi:MAG: GtrA family protein [Patescibacteria group bacterium]